MAVVTPEARPSERAPTNTSRRRPARRRRPALAERITLNVVVGVVAALLAFVLAAALLAERRETTTVAVASQQIAAGTPLMPDLVTSEEVPTNVEFSGQLVPFDRIASGGMVAARTLQPGEPIALSAVGEAESTTPRRVMSIPLESWQAANGDVAVGDQVDVIVTSRDTAPRYVLTTAAVVGRSGGGDGGGLVGGASRSDLIITVEVDEDEALDLAAAIDAGTITVVRSTGVAPSTPEAGG
ncbi:MAG: SAF domain-containing protein [Acidimicrobiia bacterium]